MVNVQQPVRIPYLDFELLFRPLFEVQQMAQVDEMALNRFLVTLMEMREQAGSLNFPLEQEQQVIIAIIQNRLDFVSRSLWMWQLDRREPTLDLLTDFLVKRCNRIESHERPSTSNQAQGAVPKRNVPNQGTVQRAPSSASAGSQAGPSEQSAAAKGKKHKPICMECNGEHYLHKCERFWQMWCQA